MSTCVIALEGKQPAKDLLLSLIEAQTPILNYDLVEPLKNKTDSVLSNHETFQTELKDHVNFYNVKLLNPKLTKKERQKTLATWLIPFGFVTGLGFSQMTGLNTFSEMGFPNQFEKLLGGLVGMISGWLGSIFSAGGVSQDIYDDLRVLQKKSEQGFWLLILELPMETELPWSLLKHIDSKEIITIGKD